MQKNARRGCDLLEKSYLCGINNNKVFGSLPLMLL